MRLKGRLDAAALHDALQDLLDRHGALRANLGPAGDTLCVLDCVQLALPTFDYSKLDDAEREAAVAERLRLAVATRFALPHDPLFRADLRRLGPADPPTVLTPNPIIPQALSGGVLHRAQQ